MTDKKDDKKVYVHTFPKEGFRRARMIDPYLNEQAALEREEAEAAAKNTKMRAVNQRVWEDYAIELTQYIRDQHDDAFMDVFERVKKDRAVNKKGALFIADQLMISVPETASRARILDKILADHRMGADRSKATNVTGYPGAVKNTDMEPKPGFPTSEVPKRAAHGIVAVYIALFLLVLLGIVAANLNM